MPKHDAFSPKAISKMIKAKGLSKLRWYCQMCQKSCRDENGFKCHKMSESHQRQMKIFAANSGTYMHNFSREFERGFVDIFSRQGGRRVKANDVYQEYIKDRHHVHMNSTMWTTLTQFVYYLGKKGIAVVDENEAEGGKLYITYINRDPDYLLKKEKLREMNEDEDKQRKHEEKRIERLLKKQHKQGMLGSDPNGNNPSQAEYKASKLERSDSNEKIKFGFGNKALTLKDFIEDDDVLPELNHSKLQPNASNSQKSEKNGKDVKSMKSMKSVKSEKAVVDEARYHAMQKIAHMNVKNHGKKRPLSEMQRLMLENEEKKKRSNIGNNNNNNNNTNSNSSSSGDDTFEREKKRRRLNSNNGVVNGNRDRKDDEKREERIKELSANCVLMPGVIVKIEKGQYVGAKARVMGFDVEYNEKKGKEYLLLRLMLLKGNWNNKIVYEKEKHLQTVIPNIGKNVKVLEFGKYRGMVGVLTAIEQSKFRGVVEVVKASGKTKQLKLDYDKFSKLSA